MLLLLPMNCCKPNLGRTGRVLRAVLGVLLLLAGVFVATQHLVAGVLLLASSAFVLFEAGRGWCALRACGLKTRL